ncbi:MAG: hypothetical protein IJE21_02995 [Alistipes sp.]|nr:hypothetical protein [Alistipes sp.]
MKRCCVVIVVLWLSLFDGYAQTKSAININTLAIGEKYSREEIVATLGTPDSEEVDWQSGLTTLRFGESEVYWYNDNHAWDKERNMIWGVRLQDNRFALQNSIRVGTLADNLPLYGSILSERVLSGGKNRVIYWTPTSLPDSLQESYLTMIYVDNNNKIVLIRCNVNDI